MAIGTSQSAGNMKLDYMNLLVTQMQNQNPLEPMSNEDMSAQLAQFSQLEQLENLNGSFDQVLQNSQRAFANDMIGKEVSFVDMESFGADGTAGVLRSGQVTKMDIFGDMEMLTISEIDPVTLQTKQYTIDSEKVKSAQLDQFSQFSDLEQIRSLDNLNQSFGQVLQSSQRSFTNGMIGKQVSFVDSEAENADGTLGLVRTGQITKMDMFADKDMLTISEINPVTGEVSEHRIEASKITGISPLAG
jgi:flagellar basal-body rod modification protein FlgD